MKSQYLIDLLRQHSRVIIPNFGAFLLKTKPHSDSDTDLHISFNDFLKFNDGLLIDYVAQTEQIDKYEAEHQIKEFVSKIQYSLINDGKYLVEGLGIIFKDDKGNLKFDKETEGFKKPSKPVVPTTKKTESKTGLSPLIKDKKETIDKKETETKEKVSFNIPKKESPKPVAEKPKEKPVARPAVRKTTPTAPVSKPTKPARTAKKKRLLPIWRHVLLVLAVMLVVAIILYLAGFFDSTEDLPYVEKNQVAQTSLANAGNNQDNDLSENEEPDSETKNSESAVKTDNHENTNDGKPKEEKAIVEKPDQQNTKVKTKETAQPPPQNKVSNNSQKNTADSHTQGKYSSKPKPYHIIAGSFNDKGNAYNYVLKLRAQGFDSRIVNKRNGFYRVAFGSYASKSEALTNLQDIRQNQNADAWYLYHRISE